MRAKRIIIASLLCLGLLGACTGSDTPEEPTAKTEESRIPGAIQNQFGALDKAKNLQNKVQKQQNAQERQFDAQSQ